MFSTMCGCFNWRTTRVVQVSAKTLNNREQTTEEVSKIYKILQNECPHGKRCREISYLHVLVHDTYMYRVVFFRPLKLVYTLR